MSLDAPKLPLISQERLQHVINLASTIAQSNQGFNLNPPKMVVDDPSILSSENVVQRLMGTTWLLHPAGGGEERLSFPELIVTLFNLFALRQQIEIEKKRGFPEGKVQFALSFDVDRLLSSPDMVRGILSKLKITHNPPAGK